MARNQGGASAHCEPRFSPNECSPRIDRPLILDSRIFWFKRVHQVMHIEASFGSATSERLKKENGLLLKIYRAAFARDLTSNATESARSNLIALRHTVRQV